jgi:hypothetical protein
MTRRRTLRPRDQAVSSFSATLLRLCDATGAIGAALVDAQGETVDYAGYLEPYVLKVMAAELRIVLEVVRHVEKLNFSDVHEFVVRARQKSFALIALAEGYALVLELPRGAFSFSRRAVAEAARELEAEAGLPPSKATGSGERWSKLEVRTVPGDRRRPEAVWFQGAWQPVTIVGRYATSTRGGSSGRAATRSGDGNPTPGARSGHQGPTTVAPPARMSGRPDVLPAQASRRPGAPRSPTHGAETIAFRARLATGHEFALVREPMGRWFADDLSGFEPVPR